MDLFDQKIKVLATHFLKNRPLQKLFAIYEAQCHGGGKLGPPYQHFGDANVTAVPRAYSTVPVKKFFSRFLFQGSFTTGKREGL